MLISYYNLLSVVVLLYISSEVCGNTCDETNSSSILNEGNIGEAVDFPWLGVLRLVVQGPTGPAHIGATGAVLVTFNYVVVNSADVAKVSKERLTRHGVIHFIPELNKSWSCKIKDVTIHPEYEYTTYNTIALLELDLDVEDRVIIRPICWPGRGFNTANALYVAGYTDERLLLEKIFYKVQYITKDLCDEFYKRSSLRGDMMQDPKQYVCGFATNNKLHCQWDNGIVLLSNVTGRWTWVGFGVAGPGCSAPARFVDISYYIDWIQVTTADPMMYDNNPSLELRQ